MTSWTSLPTEEAFIMLRALGRVALTVLTFHTEVERARADPAPEHKAPPPGYDAPGPSRS